MKKYAVLLFLSLIFFFSSKATAQYSKEHYIAPSPWQYWSDANEIVITTLSPGIVNATISKSDGTEIVTLALTSSFPAVYRFEGVPMQRLRNLLQTIYNDRGIIVKCSVPIAVNVRNIASDEVGPSDGQGIYIKGNASLVSFGDKGKGTSFRLGYYRTDYKGIARDFPVFSVLAIEDDTEVFLDNVLLMNLKAGQSYLFNAPIGSHLTSNKMIVANAGAYSDAPGGCADGVVTQVIPAQSLGKNYIIVRGNGTAGTQTNYPEQSTIIATQPNTVIKIANYNASGSFLNNTTKTIAAAGAFYTFHHGDAQTIYSSSFVEADKPIIIYSGSADLCEVDMSTVIPVGDCTGSNEIMIKKFTSYKGNNLDAFGYVILPSATEPVFLNGINLENLTGNSRTSIGTSGYFMIRFRNTEVGSPENYHITSNSKMTISMVQQGNGFTMSGFFSSFNETITKPEVISNDNCNKVISTQAGLAPYQWYLDGDHISGETSQTLSIKKSGSYTVTGTLDCGNTNQSSPLFVTVCSDLSVNQEIVDIDSSGNITFKIKAKNNGAFQDTNVRVNDLLPKGYTFVSSSTPIGNYNKTTGIWEIGILNLNQEVSLQIIAKVNKSGNYTNIAQITGTNLDENQINNTTQISPVWDLTFTKKANLPVYYNIGDIILYDLLIKNTGNVSIYNVSVIDTNADNGSIIPSVISTLNAGQSITIQANHTITLADVNAKQVVNQATAIGESLPDVFIRTNSDDPTTEAVKDATITPVISEADLVTVKTDNKDYYIAGTNNVYTITVTNKGPGNAYNVKINDEIPSGITVMNWTDNQGNSGNGALNSTLNELQKEASVIYTVTLTIPEDYKGNLVNTVAVSSETSDPNPDCSECTDTDLQCIAPNPICTEYTDAIPNVISPNGDGKNDFFDLSELPPISNLEIFNRFGHVVYKLQNYISQWEGQSDKGERLPDGTYYYIIHFKDAKSTAGWVYISQ